MIKIHDGEKEHLLAIPRQMIADWNQLNKALLDLGLITPTKRVNQEHLQTFLQSLKPEKKFRCVNSSGWHGNQYVFADGHVIGEGGENEGVYPTSKICPKGVRQKGTLVEWQENVLNLCLGNSRLLFSLGVAFSSMCLNLIQEEGCCFNFKGRSSIGKTKCLKVAASVFGSPDYKRSWKMTVNGLESICALYKDSLLPLDELGKLSGANI